MIDLEGLSWVQFLSNKRMIKYFSCLKCANMLFVHEHVHTVHMISYQNYTRKDILKVVKSSSNATFP